MEMDLYMHNFRESIFHGVIEKLQLPYGSSGLDVGCGVGLQCLLLAEAVGPSGHVTGLDISSASLNRGREFVKEADLLERISFKEGDMANLPFGKNTFDWTWSTDCVGYNPRKPLPLLKELIRVVKPGGTIALLAWSSENLLPGHPQLEARLGATSAGIAPYMQGNKPETHFLRALNWFRELGLMESKAEVIAHSYYAPLSEGIRNALVSLFDMRWPGAERELSHDDKKEFRRLCLTDSPDFILNLPDYYMHFSYTVFWGKVAN